MKPDELAERLTSFSVRVCKLVDALPETRVGKHLGGQLLRCGTSVPPNYEEACGAESRRDFIHKMRICLKEMRESRCWIRLIVRLELLPQARLAGLLDESEQLCNILGKSILTARNKTP